MGFILIIVLNQLIDLPSSAVRTGGSPVIPTGSPLSQSLALDPAVGLPIYIRVTIYHLYNFKRSNLMLDSGHPVSWLEMHGSLVGTFGRVSSSSSDGKTPFCSTSKALFFLLIFLMPFLVILKFLKYFPVGKIYQENISKILKAPKKVFYHAGRSVRPKLRFLSTARPNINLN